MALPTLIGTDGRVAVIAFTGTETLSRWQEDARPVPLVIEGARLRALANGQPPPLPHEDPDIHAEIAAVTPDFTLGAGGRDTDLAITLKTTDMDQARRYAEQIAVRLRVRLRRGIEIRAVLFRTQAAGSPAPHLSRGPHPPRPLRHTRARGLRLAAPWPRKMRPVARWPQSGCGLWPRGVGAFWVNPLLN